MKKFTFLTSVFLLTAVYAMSQGCVAIRNISSLGNYSELNFPKSTEKKWSLDIENRFFKASKFLQGDQNITPKNLNTGVTLYEYTMNFELIHRLNNGWSLAFDLPIVSNAAKGELEHASGDYHSTHAYGIGDMRFTVYKWLMNNDVAHKGNIQFGLGIKFPTANYHTEDYFYTSATDKSFKELAPVNVAIQPGDGGTGITTQLNTFYNFNKHVGLYGNFFYLISPKDVNGVAAWPPGLLPDNVAALFHATTYDVNSVPDNYSTRAGANFTFSNLVLAAGLRYEGAPAHDLIGQDDGLRRVGHIMSAEPGVTYKFKHSYLYADAILPFERKTIETVPDERQAAITGMYTITPGHFADYIIYVGYSFSF